MTTKTTAYLRVSTDQQDTRNQQHGIEIYAAARGLTISETVQDTASGSLLWHQRGVRQIIDNAEPGDILLVAEISRLARSTIQVLEIMRAAAERSMVIHVAKNSLVMDGSMQSKITATILGLAAEIEREFIIARTTESLARRRAAGLPMGRPPGQAERVKLDALAGKIAEWEKLGLGRRSIARLAHCSPSTLYAWLARRSKRMI